MEFALLGGLDVHSEDGRGRPTAPKQRQVLAALLLNANRVTYVDSLATELWGDHPPESLLTTLQTYIYQLRRLLSGSTDPDVAAGGVGIETRPQGYLLRTPAGSVDVEVFTDAVGRARAVLDTEPEEASRMLADALRLWRGPALADVECGDVLSGHVAHLDELRLCAVELSLEAGMRAGRHRELIGDLKRLVRTHPFHETYHAQLVRALALSGRRQEAVDAYRSVTALLRRELGVDPSACLEDAFRVVLGAPDGRRSGAPVDRAA
ncbi:AfsR/SARP family transcriptional regulator [Actinomycetospora termitidis]|uniref:AfsR/SARP family transcriptional regulator n=1 Tax=Actinomycetospora termitidis TaxID=3053470 RepID=A0ABT7MD40_9PSEU|nr:AfsR/SARP family transcriptional regulator [Actinomycetospora sp. Odt1-22]MDL5158588.1 AfsR/SARP family transcriptional regulator [Actinomycetospora sp. Odt1-22]